MQKPIIYYNNRLADAQDGTDGTVYATGTGATLRPDDIKKFYGNLTLSSDVSSTSTLAGLDLVFDTTENKYKLISVSAAPVAAEQNAFRSVCWSPELGIFCAVAYDSSGGSHRVMTSEDGFTWTARTAAEANEWASVCWSPSLQLFAAVALTGTNRCMTSPDGVTWTAVSVDANQWYSVIWAEGLDLFVAVAGSGTNRVMISSDGVTWTPQSASEPNQWYSVCWSPTLQLLAAVSIDGTNRVMTSPDGETWTAQAEAEANQWKCVIWASGLGLFVAVAGNGTHRVMVSANGTAWTAKTAAEANNWQSVCWAQSLGLLVAVSGDGTHRVMTSTDGTTWATATAAEQNEWRCVIFMDDLSLLLAVSDNGTQRVMASIDGSDWDPRLFQTFEGIQTADEGEDFTIQAGLTCAQASADRPGLFAADGRIAPRLTGAAANTALYLRAHAPNFVLDGGFESGALSPHWLSQASWAITSADKLEGAYSAIWDCSADGYLTTLLGQGTLKKGITYKFVFKAKAKTASPQANVLSATCVPIGTSDNMGLIYPAITTTATWFSSEFTPTKTTNRWRFTINAYTSLKGSCTGIVVDEIYVYEKITLNSLICTGHNLERRSITVNAWNLSPLRSTSGSDAANKTVIATYTPDTSEVLYSALTSSSPPVVELVIAAASDLTPEAGEIYIGDYWQLPRYPGALDPYETVEGGLREFKFNFKNIPPAYRTAQIEALFEQTRKGRPVYIQWDTDAPVLCEDTSQNKSAPYSTFATDLSRTYREKV